MRVEFDVKEVYVITMDEDAYDKLRSLLRAVEEGKGVNECLASFASEFLAEI